MSELWRLSAREIVHGIQKKEFSATEIVEAVLGRIAEKNPELNAITVEFPEQALVRLPPKPTLLWLMELQ